MKRWFKAPRETIKIDLVHATGWQMVERLNNVIIIMILQVYLISPFLIRSATSQSSN